MNESSVNECRYDAIVTVLSSYNGDGSRELRDIIKRRYNKYIFLLLLDKYNCWYLKKVRDDLNIKNKTSVRNSLKRAEEELFKNKNFRDMYFQLEEMTSKII